MFAILQEHMELEKRYRELTDLLVISSLNSKILIYVASYISGLFDESSILCIIQYYKQTQLETMASEKAAAEFQLEKELKRLQEAQVCH